MADTLVTPSNPTQTRRGRAIYALLWTSFALSLVILALSLVFLGAMSLFISPASVVLTLAFTITLLVLSTRARAASPAVSPAPDAPAENSHSSTSTLPSACRMPAIVCGFLLALLWAICFAFETVMLAVLGNVRWRRGGVVIVVSILEVAFQGVQIGIVLALAILCLKERRSLRSGAPGRY